MRCVHLTITTFTKFGSRQDTVPPTINYRSQKDV